MNRPENTQTSNPLMGGDPETGVRPSPTLSHALLAAAGLFFLVGVVVAGAFMWPDAEPVEISLPPTASAESGSPELVAHVAGEVAEPGVYRLPPGSRVGDAVQAAGGSLPGANVHAINLAAEVFDGERIVVPSAAPPAGAGGTSTGAADGDPSDSEASRGTVESQDNSEAGGSNDTSQTAAVTPEGGGSTLVDLNTASQAALEALPGIGPVLAERIIAWRETNGKFQSLDDIANVRGIGPKTTEGLRGLVLQR
ncbi:MAG: helix-hairpin-helix domain-containing protein [Chloroflexota bacterium]